MDGARLSMRVEGEPHAIRTARRLVESFAARAGLAAPAVRDLSLALAEALFNAIEHGGGNCPARLDAALEATRLVVAVEDGGCEGERRARAVGAALEACGERPPTLDQERGRGLHLMRARVDEVRTECAGDGGLRVVLVKRR